MPLRALPAAFVERIKLQFPKESAELLDSFQEETSVSLRWNAGKITGAPYSGKRIPWHPHGLWLTQRPSFTLDARLHAGAYYVQEASSMGIHAALNSQAAQIRSGLAKSDSLRILDLCAAPGGKSTLLADWKNDEDLLLSNEVVPARREVLAENLIKWGRPGCYVAGWQADRLPGNESWDIILLDAPCSGEGMFRRHQKAIDQWNDGLIDHCYGLQQGLLEESLRLLAPGGLLIFSTCTLADAENLAASERLSKATALTRIELPELVEQGWLAHHGGYLSLPHRTGGEPFFMLCFRKNGSRTAEVQSLDSAAIDRQQWDDLLSQIPFALSGHLQPVYDDSTQELMAEHPRHRAFWKSLGLKQQANHPEKRSPRGLTKVAERKGRQWIPSMESALATWISADLPRITLQNEDCLRLLKGETPAAGLSPETGYQLLCCEELPLMWSKQLGNRYNTLWPKSWRVRMKLSD